MTLMSPCAEGRENSVTTDDVKQVLRQGRRLDSRIKMLEESQEKAFARVTGATQKLSETGVHGGANADAMAEYVAYSEEIVEEIAKMQRMQRDMMRLISKVRKHDLQSVLQLYYVDGFTWEEVAVKMHYSWRWVMKLHGKALLEVARIAERNPSLLKACSR